MPIQLLQEQPFIFVAWIAAVILGITVHEFSHVLAAYAQGDETGKDLGRLTLNPFAHIDPLGLLLLIIAGFGWGRPAPYNPFNLRRPRLGSVVVALAGPLSNLLFVILAGLLFKIAAASFSLESSNLLFVFLGFLVQVNLVLLLFNLLPIPPLDGSRLLTILLAHRMPGLVLWLERFGPFLLLGVILMGQRWFQAVLIAANGLLGRLLGFS